MDKNKGAADAAQQDGQLQVAVGLYGECLVKLLRRDVTLFEGHLAEQFPVGAHRTSFLTGRVRRVKIDGPKSHRRF